MAESNRMSSDEITRRAMSKRDAQQEWVGPADLWRSMLEEFATVFASEANRTVTDYLQGVVQRLMQKVQRVRDERDDAVRMLEEAEEKREALQKQNEHLEHELIALGHVNCEWCLYWKQDEDSSDEGVCEQAGKSPWGMFRIDHREYGQAMAGHVLKTLCNFGCKEGKAKPI